MTEELPTQARPVQQVSNPVKPDKWKIQNVQMRPDLWPAITDFAEKHGYEKREIVDVALRDYLKLPEPKD